MKKIVCSLISILLLLSLVSCGKLPMEISQEDWFDAKEEVKLSTGITMTYIEMGNPEGPVVILQHGMTDNSRSWSFVAPYFTQAGYHVYIPELRGMGSSDAPDGYYTVTTYAADLKAFFDAMEIEKAILVGHSLGSYVSQAFSIMFSERCEKLVLVSSLPLMGYQNEIMLGAYHNYIESIADDGHPTDAFIDVWYNCTLSEPEYQDVFETFISYMKKEAQSLSGRAWKNIVLGLLIDDYSSLFEQIDHSIPVLILHGNEDTMAVLQYQQQLCDIFEVGENSYRNYVGIGHNIQYEMPKGCATDILTWLATGSLPN